MTTCWFCESKTADDEMAVSVFLYGQVQRDKLDYGITRLVWKNEMVAVPRCRTCARREGAVFYTILGGLLGTSVLAVLSYFLARLFIEDRLLVCAVIAGLVVSCGVAITFVLVRRFRLDGKNPAEHPCVQEMLKTGWHLGKHPPEMVQLVD